MWEGTMDLPRGFVWWAPRLSPDGFAISEDRLDSGDFYRFVFRLGASLHPYHPFVEEPALFLVLANTPATPERIVQFADRYGPLAIGRVLLTRKGTLAPENIFAAKEPVASWRSAIHWLAALVHLWEAVQHLREGGASPHPAAAPRWVELTDLIVWNARGVRVQGLSSLDPTKEPMSPLITTDELRALGVKNRDVVRAAIVVLARALTTQIDSITCGLDWTKRLLLSPVWSPKIPNLWSAICLQFAAAVVNNKRYQRCQGCGRWLELAPGANRADRLTCSDACRQKAHRDRQAKARQLHGEGYSPEDIAQRIGSSVEAVQRWVLADPKD
jgi:hypothetical protein